MAFTYSPQKVSLVDVIDNSVVSVVTGLKDVRHERKAKYHVK